MNYAEIKYFDTANGPGVRTSLFVSGCTHRCPDCFNSIAWSFDYGEEFTEDVSKQIYQSCEPDYIAGLTILGGEPFEPENQGALLPFLLEFRKIYPNKTVWIFSGYTYEELTGRVGSRCYTDIAEKMLSLADVLVDGRFEKDKKDLTLRFRGSSNQRLIDIKKTRETGEIVLWTDDLAVSSRRN